MFTVTIESTKDNSIVKYKYSEKSLKERVKASIICSTTNSDLPYTVEKAIRILSKDLGQNSDVISVLKKYKLLGDRALEILFELNDEFHDELSSNIRNVDFPTKSKQKIYVPKILTRFSEVFCNDRGFAVGKGEILACLLFKQTTGAPNARYDIDVAGIPWHIKDHRNCDSTPLGRPNVENDDNPSWRLNETFSFIWGLGAKSNFGTKFFKNNRQIEKLIMQEYNTTDLLTAALALEFDLDSAMRDSSLMGDAPGILFLKDDEKGLYFERVDSDDLHFHSISNDGIKICDEKNRFVDSIMFASTVEEKLKQERNEKLKKEIEKKKNLISKKEIKIKIKEEQSMQRKKEIEKKIYTESKEFCNKWNNVPSIDILEQVLGTKSELLRSKKKRIEMKYPEFKFKELKKAKKVKQ